MRKIIVFVSLLLILGSCSEQGECSGVSSNILKIGFYNFGDRKPKSIALDSIKVEGSALKHYVAQNVPSIQLPLNPESESITYLIYFGGSAVELNVQYEIKTFALAPGCLAIDLYSISDATGPIPQIFFTQKAISKNATENIKLFF